MLKASLDVNATLWGLTVLENLQLSNSSAIEMALKMEVNPELRDGEGRDIMR